MIKILFVCWGNICRSPMAEFVFKKMVADEGFSHTFTIASAATSSEEIGNDIYPPAKAEMKKQGIPFTRRSARQIRPEDFETYDLVIGMDSTNARSLNRTAGNKKDSRGIPYASKIHSMMSFAGKSKDVADPWYTRDFHRTYCDIVEGCRGLLETCKEMREFEWSRRNDKE